MFTQSAVPACSGLRLPDRSVPRFASVRSMGIFAVACQWRDLSKGRANLAAYLKR